MEVSRNHIDIESSFLSGDKYVEVERLTSKDNKVTRVLLISEVENGLIKHCWWSIQK